MKESLAEPKSNLSSTSILKGESPQWMECRAGCGACCIAISISSPIPGMPNGKLAGVRCVNLSSDNRCTIFGKPERPRVCLGFRAERLFCGDTNQEAMEILSTLEK